MQMQLAFLCHLGIEVRSQRQHHRLKYLLLRAGGDVDHSVPKLWLTAMLVCLPRKHLREPQTTYRGHLSVRVD